MRWLRWVSVTCAVSMALSACVLRPRYQDLTELSPGEGPITLALVDADTGAPLSQTAITIGDGVGRLKLQTDEQGRVTIPRDERLRAMNSLIVVDKPKGVERFRFDPISASAQSAVEASPSTPATTSASETTEPQTGSAQPPDGGVGPGRPPGKNAPSHQDAPDVQPMPVDAGTPAQ